MKQQEIQLLLDRYAKGQLSEEEQGRLKEITHMETVLESSMLQAAAVRSRRRGMVSLMIAGVAVLGGVGLWLAPDRELPQPTLVAQSAPMESVLSEEEPGDADSDVIEHFSPSVSPTAYEPVAISADEPVKAVEEREPLQVPVETESVMMAPVCDEMQILCNISCDADSVLSGVLRFLQA